MADKKLPELPTVKKVIKDVKTPTPADVQERYYGKPELDPRKL